MVGGRSRSGILDMQPSATVGSRLSVIAGYSRDGIRRVSAGRGRNEQGAPGWTGAPSLYGLSVVKGRRRSRRCAARRRPERAAWTPVTGRRALDRASRRYRPPRPQRQSPIPHRRPSAIERTPPANQHSGAPSFLRVGGQL